MPELTSAQRETVQDLMASYHVALYKEGINETFLAKKLKSELNAKEVKAFKSTSGDRENGFTTEVVYSKRLVAWDIRQRARMDAQKLLGLYPAEKVEHSGTIDVGMGADLTPEKWKLIEAFVQKDLSGLEDEHRRDIRRREGIPTPPG